MFGTVIQEVYERDHAPQVSEAIEELCSPKDNYGWASSGLYCFWDPDTRETLYLGLATNLRQRFDQHSGLRACDANNCKKLEIEDFFANHRRLGFSMLVRSPLEQNMGGTEVPFTEGLMIATHELVYGGRPTWNKIGGSRAGQEAAREAHAVVLRCFIDGDPSLPPVARGSLRHLANSAQHTEYETWLHGARMRVLNAGADYFEAIESLARYDTLGVYRRIREEGYLRKPIAF